MNDLLSIIFGKMFRPGRTLRGLLPLAGMALALSCTIDAYDKGEGDYSLLTAEMVEAHVNQQKQLDYAVTDEGERLNLVEPFSSKWVQKADTVYRGLLYYNKLGEGKAEAVSMAFVGVLQEADIKRDSMKTDPLHVESIWMSKNGAYLNLRLRLLTGATDDEKAVHTIGLVRDSLSSTDTHTRLLLFHNQGGKPEYYSTTVYASIPLAKAKADTLTLSINTYNGMMSRSYILRQGK